MIQQTYGHEEKGEWVQTTTRSQDLFQRIENRIKAMNPQSYFKGYDPSTFEGQWWFETPDIDWNPNPKIRNPDSRQKWDGDIWLLLKKGKNIDGIDQYSLDKVRHEIHWWHKDNGDWQNEGYVVNPFGGESPPAVPPSLLTENDLKSVVTRWNERADLK